MANGNEELRETLRTASERVSSALNEQQQLIERQANAQVDLEATQVRRDCVLRQLAHIEASRRATCEHEVCNGRTHVFVYRRTTSNANP